MHFSTVFCKTTTRNDQIRELNQGRRRHRGRRLVKSEFIFYQRKSQLSRSEQYANGSRNVLRRNILRQRSIPDSNTKNQPSSFAFTRRRRTWSFHVLVLQRTEHKCTNIKKARAQLLFCSLNLLFGGVLVAVVVVCGEREPRRLNTKVLFQIYRCVPDSVSR